jgi:hypothetical protein
MTESLPDGSVESAAEFQAVIAAAIEQAVLGDVDVRGAWEFDTGGSHHQWEVQITELARDRDED